MNALWVVDAAGIAAIVAVFYDVRRHLRARDRPRPRVGRDEACDPPPVIIAPPRPTPPPTYTVGPPEPLAVEPPRLQLIDGGGEDEGGSGGA